MLPTPVFDVARGGKLLWERKVSLNLHVLWVTSQHDVILKAEWKPLQQHLIMMLWVSSEWKPYKLLAVREEELKAALARQASHTSSMRQMSSFKAPVHFTISSSRLSIWENSAYL